MSAPEEPGEPLQKLPAGMPRRYAEYRPATSDASTLPITNVGGYDELLSLFHERGQALPRTGRGLAAIDTLLDDDVDKHALAGFARPIGMFYGDVLTHTIPGAHWEVIEEAYPRVCITRTAAVDVIGVAMRRLEVADPTLEQNYAHVLERLGLET
ncbi:DUF6278 family protein [Arthrobacter globiformis]|uniref:DUF6278 family protein n=1 Tax=Arthrobacter globiformis TaxID=1665 RepID=UPI00278D805D|nr:DUF6278 family protein [Arthrobacter globiformis]MDQ0618888.1 hypothetical protein [Arthrobacter globiformis]